MSQVAKVKFRDYANSVGRALDLIGAGERLRQGDLVMIKPNLTNADGPPVTTPVEAVEAVYCYCQSHCHGEIVIAEGCGKGTTAETFSANGYSDLSEKYGIRLIDLNNESAVTVVRRDALQLKEFHIPKIVQDAFVISVPVLKDHSFTETTIAMKNMFGIAPAPFYLGSWNKSKLHSPSTHKSVVDVCLYKSPDLSVVDATTALTGMHLSGRSKTLNTILAGFDPVAVDTIGSAMLGHRPKTIEYLTLADGRLGQMDPIETLS